MSAPTVERTRRAVTQGAVPPARGTHPDVRVPTQRGGSGAVGRAYARRNGRLRRAVEPVDPEQAGRPRFVLMVMGLLGAGLVASLWLSTSAAADSYRLEQATRATRDLSERSESLRTEIAALRSAPALAQAARELGMVPVSDVARLVAQRDGSVVVVGTPRAGVVPAPPPPPEGVLPPGSVSGAVHADAAAGQVQAPGQTGGPGQIAVPGQPGVAGPAQTLSGPAAQDAGTTPLAQDAPVQNAPARNTPAQGRPARLAAGSPN